VFFLFLFFASTREASQILVLEEKLMACFVETRPSLTWWLDGLARGVLVQRNRGQVHRWLFMFLEKC